MKKIAVLHYTAIPNMVIEDPSLNPTTKALYFAILKYANKNGYCTASQRTLAQCIGKSERQVKNLLVELKKRNLITIHPPSNFKGTNTYIPLVTYTGGKMVSPHTGNYYQPFNQEQKCSVLPTKSNIKVNIKNKEDLNDIRKKLNEMYTVSK